MASDENKSWWRKTAGSIASSRKSLLTLFLECKNQKTRFEVSFSSPSDVCETLICIFGRENAGTKTEYKALIYPNHRPRTEKWAALVF